MKFNNINIFISPKAKIGKNVRVGDNSTIYDNVVIGDNTVISDHCVIGEPNNNYYSEYEKYENPLTVIGKNSVIRSFTIIYAGCSFGKEFSTGHRVTIRENSIFGDNCRIGTISDIQGNCSFGNHCWLHSNVHIGQGSKIGNFVFIYPYVVFTNDPTPPSNLCVAPEVGDFSQIAVFSTLLPGVKIGKHALIGAGSVVSRNIPDYKLAMGSPAKIIKDVRDIVSRESGESHYPWPQRFSRGMPWESLGYAEWQAENE
jgi:acetyltransferase-like isoleucine patch superfamily enzyme